MTGKQVETITIVGKKGSGKSYYAGYILECLLFRTKKPFVILDYHKEHLGFTDIAGVKKFKLTEDYIGRINWKRLILSCKGLIVYPEKVYRHLVNQEFSEICRVIMEIENTLLLVDECSNLAPNNAIDENFELVVTEGRKFGVELISADQRTQQIDKTILSQSSKLVCFTMFEENDLSHVKGIFPDVNQLRHLKRFLALEYDSDKGTIRKVRAGKRVVKHYG